MTLSPDPIPTRICTGPCGRELQATTENFHRASKGRYGVAARCKECVSDSASLYFQENREAFTARKQAYREDGRLSAWGRVSYQRHRDTLLPKQRAYAKEYREANPEAVRERTQRWKADNPERVRHHLRRRYALRKGAEGSHTLQEWVDLQARFDHRCVACLDAGRPLTMDHVVSLVKGGSDSIDNIQPLCQSCNSHKGVKATDYRIDFEKRLGLVKAGTSR